MRELSAPHHQVSFTFKRKKKPMAGPASSLIYNISAAVHVYREYRRKMKFTSRSDILFVSQRFTNLCLLSAEIKSVCHLAEWQSLIGWIFRSLADAQLMRPSKNKSETQKKMYNNSLYYSQTVYTKCI